MSVTVDFIARGSSDDEWLMVLVEEGSWQQVNMRLRSIQDRLYGCIDAAIDGQLAQKFPQTNGKRIVIRLDCYDAPELEVSNFFERFSNLVFVIGDYKQALADSRYASEITFELNFDTTD
ncbi:MAG: DUF6572 domain-containing protein [Hyphomonas sp.]